MVTFSILSSFGLSQGYFTSKFGPGRLLSLRNINCIIAYDDNSLPSFCYYFFNVTCRPMKISMYRNTCHKLLYSLPKKCMTSFIELITPWSGQIKDIGLIKFFIFRPTSCKQPRHFCIKYKSVKFKFIYYDTWPKICLLSPFIAWC